MGGCLLFTAPRWSAIRGALALVIRRERASGRPHTPNTMARHREPVQTSEEGPRVPLDRRVAGLFTLVFIVAAYYVIFRLPFRFPPTRKISSPSVVFGFNNSVAIICVIVLIAVAMVFLLWRRGKARGMLEGTAWIRVEHTPPAERIRPSVFALMMLAHALLTLAMWVKAQTSAPWRIDFEASHFLWRLQLMELFNARPYLDFQHEYGPALLYLPMLLYCALRPTGLSLEDGVLSLVLCRQRPRSVDDPAPAQSGRPAEGPEGNSVLPSRGRGPRPVHGTQRQSRPIPLSVRQRRVRASLDEPAPRGRVDDLRRRRSRFAQCPHLAGDRRGLRGRLDCPLFLHGHHRSTASDGGGKRPHRGLPVDGSHPAARVRRLRVQLHRRRRQLPPRARGAHRILSGYGVRHRPETSRGCRLLGPPRRRRAVRAGRDIRGYDCGGAEPRRSPPCAVLWPWDVAPLLRARRPSIASDLRPRGGRVRRHRDRRPARQQCTLVLWRLAGVAPAEPYPGLRSEPR